MTTTTATPERTWLSVGAELVERIGGQATVEAAVDALEWQPIPDDDGAAPLLGFSQGYAIRAAIKELRLPNVSAIADSTIECPGTDGEDGFYPGFYSIEANYTNGRARIYLVDTGLKLVPVMSELYSPEQDEFERKRKIVEAANANVAQLGRTKVYR